jgi:surface protein
MANIIKAIYKHHDSNKQLFYNESYIQHVVNLYVNGVKIDPTNKLRRIDKDVPTCVEIEFDDSLDTLDSLFQFTNVIYVGFMGFESPNIESMNSLFSCCNVLESVDFGKLNTSNVLDMSYLFKGCCNLKSIDLSMFDTSNVGNFVYMFSGCNHLKSIDLSNFNTSSASNMEAMFELCDKLKEINISSFDVSNVLNMNSMFRYDSCLERIQIGTFDTKSLLSCSHMFYACEKLRVFDTKQFNNDGRIMTMRSMFESCEKMKKIDLSNMTTSLDTDADNIFSYCKKALVIDINKFASYSPEMFDRCDDLRELNLKDKIITIKKK